MMPMVLKFNYSAFRALRTLPSMQTDMLARAQRIAAACGGGGYKALPTLNPINRARAAVVTTDFASIRDNAVNNTILRNLSAGR